MPRKEKGMTQTLSEPQTSSAGHGNDDWDKFIDCPEEEPEPEDEFEWTWNLTN